MFLSTDILFEQWIGSLYQIYMLKHLGRSAVVFSALQLVLIVAFETVDEQFASSFRFLTSGWDYVLYLLQIQSLRFVKMVTSHEIHSFILNLLSIQKLNISSKIGQVS